VDVGRFLRFEFFVFVRRGPSHAPICRRGGIRGGGRNEAISQIKPRLTRKKVPYGSPTMTKSKKKANEVADYNDRVQQAVDGIRSGLYRSSYHAATELNVKPNSRQCCRDLPAQGSLVSNGIRSVQEPNRNRSRPGQVIKYLGGDLVQVVISYTNLAYIWEITALSKISKSVPCTRMALGATTPPGKIWIRGIVW